MKEQKAVKSKNKKKAAIQKKVNKNKTKISEIALETGAFEDAQPEAPAEEAAPAEGEAPAAEGEKKEEAPAKPAEKKE